MLISLLRLSYLTVNSAGYTVAICIQYSCSTTTTYSNQQRPPPPPFSHYQALCVLACWTSLYLERPVALCAVFGCLLTFGGNRPTIFSKKNPKVHQKIKYIFKKRRFYPTKKKYRHQSEWRRWAPFKRPYGVWMVDVFFLPSSSSKTEEITKREGSKKRRRLIFPFTRRAGHRGRGEKSGNLKRSHENVVFIIEGIERKELHMGDHIFHHSLFFFFGAHNWGALGSKGSAQQAAGPWSLGRYHSTLLATPLFFFFFFFSISIFNQPNPL